MQIFPTGASRSPTAYRRAAPDYFTQKRKFNNPDFRVLSLLKAMSEGSYRAGESYEAEVSEAYAQARGESFNPRCAFIPWGTLMQRDLNVASPVMGGNLVGSQAVEVADQLRPVSLAARLGVKFIDQPQTDLLLPRVGYSATGNWLATETSNIMGNDPVLGLTTAKPKIAGARIKGSLNFLQGSSQSELFIRNQLAGAMGDLLDQALFAGTGAGGQPLGLNSTPGLGVVNGVFDRDKALDMECTVAGIVGDEIDLAWVTTPLVRKSIKKIPMGTSGLYLWNKDGLVDRPGYTTRNCPASTLFMGDWRQAQIVLWGGGLQIELDPYTSFKSGAVEFRVLMFADVDCNASAFFKWTA